MAEKTGVLVVNKPSSLRNANEKLFALQFPQCTPPTLVTSQANKIKNFVSQHETVILKPLGGMGGSSIFRTDKDDQNINVIIETLTQHGKHLIMAQRFIPEISKGDKRILLIDGVPVPYALARIPQKGDVRANLATGGIGEGMPLSEHDKWICEQVGPRLKQEGLLFVGLDVIGDYLTEINVTSPTCIRELDTQFDLNISALLMDRIEEKIEKHSNAA
jgi:glutathione synthase